MFRTIGAPSGALLALVAWTAGLASAQNKVAVINLQRAVLESAEIKKASNELEAKFKPRQAEVEKIQKELQSIQSQLQTMAGKLTAQAEAELTTRGQRLQRDLQRRTEDLQADVDRDRNEILSKASQKMQEVVKKMSEAKGVDMVVDVSQTIYFKPVLEITTEAIAEYDKAHPVK